MQVETIKQITGSEIPGTLNFLFDYGLERFSWNLKDADGQVVMGKKMNQHDTLNDAMMEAFLAVLGMNINKMKNDFSDDIPAK